MDAHEYASDTNWFLRERLGTSELYQKIQLAALTRKIRAANLCSVYKVRKSGFPIGHKM